MLTASYLREAMWVEGATTLKDNLSAAIFFLEPFQEFLSGVVQTYGADIPVVVKSGEAYVREYDSAGKYAWIGQDAADTYNKAFEYADIVLASQGTWPPVNIPASARWEFLGPAHFVLDQVDDAIKTLKERLAQQPGTTPTTPGTAKPPKLYSRKAAIGVAAGVGLLAGLIGFAVAWARKPEPTNIVWPQT